VWWWWGCRGLSVSLGDSLDLVLLLDGIRVGGLLGAVHNLVSETLGSGLDVSESRSTRTLSDEGDSLIDSSKRGNINGLSSNNTTRADTSRVLSGTTVLDGINKNLNRVLISQKVNNLKSLLDNSDSELLLTVVSTLHHHRVDESLNNGALGLSETLLLVTASSVRQVNSSRILESDVILQELYKY
jgi:hypothetical protein